MKGFYLPAVFYTEGQVWPGNPCMLLYSQWLTDSKKKTNTCDTTTKTQQLKTSF